MRRLSLLTSSLLVACSLALPQPDPRAREQGELLPAEDGRSPLLAQTSSAMARPPFLRATQDTSQSGVDGEFRRINTLINTVNIDNPFTVCSCAKCGTTELYNWLYEVLQHRAWRSPLNRPIFSIPQNTEDPHWLGTMIDPPNGTFHDPTAYKLAFVREPVSRLVSAWKDKLSCGILTESRSYDFQSRRIHFGTALFRLEGKNRSFERLQDMCWQGATPGDEVNGSWVSCMNDYCVSLESFAEALINIHKYPHRGSNPREAASQPPRSSCVRAPLWTGAAGRGCSTYTFGRRRSCASRTIRRTSGPTAAT